MINTALIAMWSKQPFFVSIHNGARLRHVARREVSAQVRARRLREHEVVRGVLERTILLDPIIFDMWSLVVRLGTRQPHNSHHARHKTHRHLLFRVCVVVLSSTTSRSVAAAAASLMRFPSPSCRGDAANPWLESAFISHVGLCLTPSLCVFSAESRHCFVFLPGFSCQQNQDELALFLVLGVCIIEFWATWSA